MPNFCGFFKHTVHLASTCKKKLTMDVQQNQEDLKTKGKGSGKDVANGHKVVNKFIFVLINNMATTTPNHTPDRGEGTMMPPNFHPVEGEQGKNVEAIDPNPVIIMASLDNAGNSQNRPLDFVLEDLDHVPKCKIWRMK